jgi:hypothetical protein
MLIRPNSKEDLMERLHAPVPLAALALATLVGAASAASAAGPAVTVYSRDLGLVRETRALDLTGPRDTVRLEDVSESLDFTSLRLAPEGGARVARLAWRFDVASGDGLLERARGARVRVTSRGDRTTEGVLVASDGAWLVVRGDEGAVHTLSRVAVEDVRLASPPRSLALRPAVEAVIEGGRRGRVNAELSYLTGGLSWTAEHVVVRRGEGAATWSATVQVSNTTGRDYVDADLRLVAGEPRREGQPISPMPRKVTMMATDVAGAAEASAFEEQAFSEYHLYTLPRPATLRDRETQSLVMLEPREVEVAPRYLYRGGDPQGVRAQLELQNRRDAGLGVPLPAGRVRVYEPDASGALQFAGEASIRHTAEDEKLTLEVGRAFDLVAERRVLSERRIADREREQSVEVKLRNRKKTAVTIGVEEGVSGDVEVVRSSHPATRKDASTLRFEIPVAAGQEVVLTWTVRLRW